MRKSTKSVDSEDCTREVSGGIEDKQSFMSHSVKEFVSKLSTSRTLWEAEFKGDGLVNLAEEISKHHSTEAVAQLLLAAFSRVTRKQKQSQSI